MEEANAVFDILLFDEMNVLIERIGTFEDNYNNAVSLGYAMLSEKESGQPKPAYFTLEKKFLPF